jgi:hypothetical protein
MHRRAALDIAAITGSILARTSNCQNSEVRRDTRQSERKRSESRALQNDAIPARASAPERRDPRQSERKRTLCAVHTRASKLRSRLRAPRNDAIPARASKLRSRLRAPQKERPPTEVGGGGREKGLLGGVLRLDSATMCTQFRLVQIPEAIFLGIVGSDRAGREIPPRQTGGCPPQASLMPVLRPVLRNEAGLSGYRPPQTA